MGQLKHQFKSDKKALALLALGTVALLATIQMNVVRVTQLNFDGENENQADLSSLKDSKTTRQSQLGQPVQAKSDSNKEIDVLLNDPAMSQKWDLKSIQTQDAWVHHRALGSKAVKVCVIDTGIDVNHPDLKANLWTNPGETGRDKYGRDKATNQVDDDGDGCVDDVHGCNFIANNGDLADHHGHGTHIAGAIGAAGGTSGHGAVGVSPHVTLIIAKYYDPEAGNNNNLMNTVKAIRYCIQKGANIINYSGGGLEPSDKEREAIALAREKGILFVAAAGNEQSNSDIKKYYPADYGLDNIISVTAFDEDRNVLPSSNYGEQSVDIAAPGKKIYSTLPGGNYGYMTGTSQATAVVTGVAALIKARFADFDAQRIIRHITETGDLEPVKLAGKTRFQKRLNAYRALAILDSGVSVSGAIPVNMNHIPKEQFALETRENAAEGAHLTVRDPANLSGFGKDLRDLINQRDLPRPQ
jgi:subtilisin family serine protease